MYKTGIPACDALVELHIQGNIIPRIWFKTIVKDDLKNPKPHLLAINILADIVYWYRPKEIRDEITGDVKGYSKKFRSDLLQRSYDDLAETFSCSKDTAKEAVVFLEKKIGVIYRDIRDLVIGGVCCNNVMFLGLNVERLRELTYPSGEILMEGRGKSSRSGEEILTEPMGESPRTNTENSKPDISSYTSSYSSQSIYRNEPAAKPSKTTPDTIDRINEKRTCRSVVKKNIEYDLLCFDYGSDRVNELLELIVDHICTTRSVIKVCGDEIPSDIVIGRLYTLTRYHVEYVINCLDKNTTKVRNIKSYLLTALYNAPLTMNHYYTSEVSHDMYAGSG